MRSLLLAGVAIGWTVGAHAAPTLDGSGFGVPSATVAYDPAAPTSNFGSPGATTSGAAYDIYARSDATYAYILLLQNGVGTSAGTFSNLYFGTGSTAFTGSDVGFEVTNSDVFSPASGSTTSTAGTGIEFAVPFSYFETDPQGIGFNPVTAANPNIVLRLSQSFGYSVAGGPSYGVDRLALIVDPFAAAVPEPTTLALLAVPMALTGLLARHRRRENEMDESERAQLTGGSLDATLN